ncbi:MAG: SoxR reducing system RseC family protein [Clostridia bacterium]|nr:SoxR reducing system RseC family protein [Clostridia bacterium]
MQTKATVVAVDGDFATVESVRTSACEGCHKAEDGGCSVCSLMGSDQKISTRAYNPIGAVVGDRVMVESNTGRILLYAAIVFLLPLVLGFLFWGLTACLTDSILWQVCGGCFGFVICFVGVFFYSRNKRKKSFDVEIIEIVESENRDRRNCL